MDVLLAGLGVLAFVLAVIVGTAFAVALPILIVKAIDERYKD